MLTERKYRGGKRGEAFLQYDRRQSGQIVSQRPESNKTKFSMGLLTKSLWIAYGFLMCEE
jgi:hypothetical protein